MLVGCKTRSETGTNLSGTERGYPVIGIVSAAPEGRAQARRPT
jgi:hypothetical protein